MENIIKELKSINKTLQLIASKMERVDDVVNINVGDFDPNEITNELVNKIKGLAKGN